LLNSGQLAEISRLAGKFTDRHAGSFVKQAHSTMGVLARALPEGDQEVAGMFQHDSQIPASRDDEAQWRPPVGTLDKFTLESGCENGVTLTDLEPGTRITVFTKHSTYRFDVIDSADGRATVVGGSVFPEPTEVRVEGATTGGSVIKSGWIGVGLRLELTEGLRRITTSRVKGVHVDKSLASPHAA
jgi:hypothetical protein